MVLIECEHLRMVSHDYRIKGRSEAVVYMRGVHYASCFESFAKHLNPKVNMCNLCDYLSLVFGGVFFSHFQTSFCLFFFSFILFFVAFFCWLRDRMLWETNNALKHSSFRISNLSS